MEFSPIYMAKTVMRLHLLPDMNAFIHTFYPDRTDHSPLFPSNMQGNLHIKTYHGSNTDMTLLMRICMRYPAIKVTFRRGSSNPKLTPEIQDLFSRISSGVFCPDFERAINTVFMRCDRNPTITFQLLEGCLIEDIMPKGENEEVRRWLVGLGAPRMDAFAITLDDYVRVTTVREERV